MSQESKNSDIDWRHDANCLDQDPELFFPIGTVGLALMQIKEAKQVCQGCDVRTACLDWALQSGVDHGVWGGMSEEERRKIRRRSTRSRIRH